MMNIQETYMQRCIDLALQGAGSVAPNPMVGAVLVCNNRVIGEGYHEKYGEAHAEVNCLNSVSMKDRDLISSATLYVSLEPCAHYGKTPPCSLLIIEKKIPQVVIGCSDPFSKVNGKGITDLKEAGIEVVMGILEDQAKELNKRFFIFHQQNRPFIILKWAETADHFIASDDDRRLLISNEFSNRMVHRWRSEEDGILVGTNTALKDNPSLTNRLWKGKNPIRLVIDKDLKIPIHNKLLDSEVTTLVFNQTINSSDSLIIYVKIDFSKDIIPQILEICYQFPLQSILVEGGAKMLQSFIDAGLWDEARIIQNGTLKINSGLLAPILKNNQLVDDFEIASDRISVYRNSSTIN
jgi:diaminohydroxyphosphoribosylaminopyrimidine deaminase/5-amino-6-(5-phosphoribosylamino)uracil reductase